MAMPRNGMTRRALAGVSLGVPAAAAGIAAAACGGARENGVPNPKPPTQGVVIRFGAKDSAAPSVTEMQLLAKEDFEPAFPGARVEIEPLTGAASYFEKILALMAAGTEQDTARFDEYYIPFLVARNGIQPMDKYAARDKQFDPRGLYPTPYKAGQYQGKFYGLTTSPNTYILVYNKSAFEEAGLKPPPADYKDKSWTWNRMREDARRLTKVGATPQESRFGFMWDVSLFSRFSALVRANAGRVVDRDEDPKKGALDDPKTLELFQMFQDMRHRDRIVPADEDLKAAPAPSVVNGRIVMQATLANVGTAYKDVPFKWDFAPLPRANGNGQASTTLITNVYGMMQTTRNPELAWAWTRILGGQKHGLFQVQKNDFIPGWKSLKEEYLKLPPPSRFVGLDTADYGLPSITSVKYVEMQDTVLQGLAPIWAGTAPVKQTVDQVMPRLNALLGGS